MFLFPVFRSFNTSSYLQKCLKILPSRLLVCAYCTREEKFKKPLMHGQKSTIFALSTSSGMSAIAVVRVSGPNANDVLYKMGRFKKLPPPREALLRNVRDPETGVLLDKALLLWFPSPHSFTGEDICELHVHGGTAVVRSILNALAKLPNFVYAAPGEFTKRAFIHGKLDLTEVEGLADLLHAETEAQQQQALRQMDGALFKLYSKWTKSVKWSLANIEAYIDFSEDQNLESHLLDTVTEEITKTESEIRQHLADDYKGERLRSGIVSVFVGKPNVGKSSLLNAICQRDVAIVSASAGTTRDVIESCINIGGYLVHLSDTAGIRESTDLVEQEGVKRARKKSGDADILLFVMEARTAANILRSTVPSSDDVNFLLKEELGIVLSDNMEVSSSTVCDEHPQPQHKSVQVLLILNKCDLLTDEEKSVVELLVSRYHCVVAVSCLTGSGMDLFMNSFASMVKDMCYFPRGEEPVITQERHRKCIENCLLGLQEYSKFSKHDVVIAAEKLRNAITELGKITGKVKCDDILDIIFKDFCIGK